MGENDSLAAIMAKIAKADMLVILSDIDGLYDKNPKENEDAHLIRVVDGVTDEMKQNAGGAGSSLGTGGMITKLKAAEIANEAGIDMVIMNGDKPEKLYDLLEGKPIVTYFKGVKK